MTPPKKELSIWLKRVILALGFSIALGLFLLPLILLAQAKQRELPQLPKVKDVKVFLPIVKNVDGNTDRSFVVNEFPENETRITQKLSTVNLTSFVNQSLGIKPKEYFSITQLPEQVEHVLESSRPEDLAKLGIRLSTTPEPRRLLVPYYTQYSQTCLVTSTIMVLKYNNIEKKPWDMLRRFKQSADDPQITTYNAKDYLRENGLDAWLWLFPVFDMNVIDEFIKETISSGQPVILTILFQPRAHAIVITGWDNDYVYIHDPSGFFLKQIDPLIKDYVDYPVAWSDFDEVIRSTGLPPHANIIHDPPPAVTNGYAISEFSLKFRHLFPRPEGWAENFIYFVWDGRDPWEYGYMYEPLTEHYYQSDEILGYNATTNDSIFCRMDIANSTDLLFSPAISFRILDRSTQNLIYHDSLEISVDPSGIEHISFFGEGSSSYRSPYWLANFEPGEYILQIMLVESYEYIRDEISLYFNVDKLDSIHPSVLSKWHTDQIDTNILVSFSEAIHPYSLDNSTIIIEGSTSGIHTANFELDWGSNKVLTIDPDVDFDYEEVVTVSITAEVKDWAGNGLSPPYSFDFNIESGPDTGPQVSDIPDIGLTQGEAVAFDLDDYVSDPDNLDSEITWSYTGNQYITVEINASTHWVVLTAPSDWSGSETITFTATDPDGNSDSDDCTVTVTEGPDFTITITPSSRTISAGSSTTYTVTITPTGGFNSLVYLSIESGLPGGASYEFNPSQLIPPEDSILTIDTSSNSYSGSYSPTIVASGGGISHSASCTLQITGGLSGPVVDVWYVDRFNTTPTGVVDVYWKAWDEPGKIVTTQDWQWSANGVNWHDIDPEAIVGGVTSVEMPSSRSVDAMLQWDTRIGDRNLDGRQYDQVYFRMRINNGDNIKKLDHYDAPAGYPQGLTWDGSRLWSSDIYSYKIYKHNMDSTLSVARAYDVSPLQLHGIAWDGSRMWGIDNNNWRIWKFRSDMTPERSYDIDISNMLGGVWIDGYLWICSNNRIYQLDPSLSFRIVRESGSIPIDGIFTGITWDGSDLWLVNNGSSDQRVFKVDINTLQVVVSYPTLLFPYDPTFPLPQDDITYAGRGIMYSTLGQSSDDDWIFKFTVPQLSNFDSSPPFPLDNNEVPSITLVTPSGIQNGDISIEYQISDREGDGIDIACEYSENSGASWNPATVTGQTEGITNYSGSIIWNSSIDLPETNQTDIRFRITPFDYWDSGIPGQTEDFTVINTDQSPPAPPTNFSATPGEDQVSLSWTNPEDEDFVGTMVRYRLDTYPTDPEDSSLACVKFNSPGTEDSCLHDDLIGYQTYYYTAFAFDEIPNYSGVADSAQDSATPFHINQPPSWNSPFSDQTLDEDNSLDNQIDLWYYASDSENPAEQLVFSIQGISEPNCGVSLDSNRYIDIIPTQDWYGTCDAMIRVTDPEELYDEQSLHVTINSINDPPYIEPPVPDQEADEDNNIVIDLTPYENDHWGEDTGAGLDWAVTYYNPSVIKNVLGEYSDDDVITLIPQSDYFGTTQIQLTLIDSQGLMNEQSQYINLTWHPVNDPPEVDDIPDQSVEEGEEFTFFDLDDYVIDVDNPDSELTWTYSGNIDLIVDIDPSTHIATITYADDWKGSETITFRATDPDGLYNEDPATFTVGYINNPPVLNPIGNQTIDEGQVLEFTVTAEDPDTGDIVTISVENLPNFCQIILESPGNPANLTISCQPSFRDAGTDKEEDLIGTYPEIIFTASDNTSPPLSDSETITIFVNNISIFTDTGPGTPGYWAFKEIEALYNAKIVSGYPPEDDKVYYHPEFEVNRAQMAVFIARAIAEGDENIPEGPEEPNFPDVPKDFWAYKYIEYLKEQGVVGGYDDDLYHPEYEVDRAQMAAFISRAIAEGEENIPEGPDTPSFPDVSKDFWAYKYIEYLKERGIVSGYDDNLYHPEFEVDRGQMAVFIYRAFLESS